MDDLSYRYEHIYRSLAEGIANGRWQPGDKLPTEMQLAQQHQVSRITSKRALNLLASQGLAVRKRGLGTFVAEKQPQQPQAHNEPAKDTTPRIGLIMEDLGESYALGLFYELDRQAAALGFQLCPGVSYGDQRRERTVLRQLRELNIQGLIVMPAHGTYYDTDLLRLVLDHFPVALIDRALNGIPAPCVCSDHQQGARLITDHLVAKGHRDIVYITTSLASATSLEERYTGYEKAMQQHNLTPHRPLVMPELFRFGPADASTAIAQQQGRDFLKSWLTENPQVTALIGSEYGVAHLARACALELNKAIPQDLAIACFDEKYGYLGEYQFTHIRQDEAGIARQALDILSRMMAGENLRRQVRQVPVQLLEGEST